MGVIAWLLLLWPVSLVARAEDAVARELFDLGVEEGSRGEWNEAVHQLEASLERIDRPASRYNLVIANHELVRPLEVARHAIAFLATVEGRSHVEEAAEVRSLLDQASQRLAVLSAQGLPLGAEPRVDGTAPVVVDGSRIYVLPGPHRLELFLHEQQLESIEIQLRSGVQPWPRVRSHRGNSSLAPENAAHSLPPPARAAKPEATPRVTTAIGVAPARARRTKLALGLGVAGAVLGVAAFGTYLYALHRAEVLHDWPSTRVGYRGAAQRYEYSAAAAISLASTGGAVMAGASALARTPRRGALALSIGALALGLAGAVAGSVLVAREPGALVADTEVERPTRAGGSLLIAGALPLLTYGVGVQWELWR